MSNYLKTLVDSKDPKVDIVAVHGLNPKNKDNHGEGTWTSNGKNGKLWLRDFLAPKLPEARILLFGYDSSVFKGSAMHVVDHAKNLLNRLGNQRAEAPERPLVFIAHSLGGLVVKQAMVEAKQTDDPIRSATYGIIFFATPHRGGNLAGLGTILSNIVNISMRKPSNKLVEALRKDSIYLEQLDAQFRNQLEDFYYITFREQRSYSNIGIIVDDRSAQLGLPWKRERSIAVDRDHNSICKFDSDEDGDYEQIEDEVKKLVKDAVASAALRAALRTPTQGVRSSTSHVSSPNLLGSRFSSPTLVSKILFSTESTSDPQPTGPSRVFGGVPSEHQIRNFVGRQDLLLRLIKKLTSGDIHHRVALYGLGGVGKTDLALKCAYEIKAYSTDISVFWISAESVESLQQSILETARALDIPDSASSASVLGAVRDYLDESENGRWVLIIDHVDDLQNLKLPQGKGELSSYIPLCPHGSVLLTTRNRKVATEFADKKGDEKVSVLSETDSVELLYQLLDADQLQDGSGVHELTRALEYFPQAIVQAASFMRKNGIDIQTYLRSFSENEHGSLELLGHGLEDSNYNNAVTTLWVASFKQLQANDKYAADLLSLMSFLHYRDIPESVLLAMDDTKTPALFIQACGSLKALSFVSESPIKVATALGSKMFHVQPMIQVVMQHWLRKHGDVERWCSAALAALSKVLSAAEASQDQWQAYEICLLHVQTVNKHMLNSTNEQELRATILHQASSHFRIRGMLDIAEGMIREAILIRSRLLGDENEATLSSMHILALILFEQGKITEAENLELQAIEMCKLSFGEQHSQILSHQVLLARIWGVQHKYEDALKLQQEIFVTSTATDPECTNFTTWSIMRDLAISLCYVGRRNEARSLQLQVYKARSENLGKEHPETLVIMSDLAASYIEDLEYQEARDILQDILPYSKQIFGVDHPKTISAYEEYRFVLGRLGDNKNLRILDEVIRRMRWEEYTDTTSGFEKPNLKRTVSDSIVAYSYRTTQVARVFRRESSGTAMEVQGLGLTLAGDSEMSLENASEEYNAEDDEDDQEEFVTIKKALVTLTRWAGTMPVFNMVSDALSEQLAGQATSTDQKESPSSCFTTKAAPHLSGSPNISPTERRAPSQFEPLTRISTFQSDTNLTVTSSPELPINYSDNKIIRSMQKKIDRNVNKETYELAVKTGRSHIQDARVKWEAAKDLRKLSLKTKPWATSAKKKAEVSEKESDELPSESLLSETSKEMLITEGKEQLSLEEEGTRSLLENGLAKTSEDKAD